MLVKLHPETARSVRSLNSIMPDGFDEFSPLELVVLRQPECAFLDDLSIEKQWRSLNYSAPPDFAKSHLEYTAFVDLLRRTGARVEYLSGDSSIGLDGIYVRDASVVSPHGMVLCAMGKSERAGEPDVLVSAYAQLGIPIAGRIEPPGQLEGGDIVWLDNRSLVVGQGYRTNGDGIAQLRDILGPGVEVHVVPLPHWKGPGDVFHLMSMLSPIDRDLLLVYSPLLPVPFRQRLSGLGYKLVEVASSEFNTMGCNVMTIAPRVCLMLAGNPLTKANLEREGVEVHVYTGNEISVKGEGGPTCLTRPIIRRSGVP